MKTQSYRTTTTQRLCASLLLCACSVAAAADRGETLIANFENSTEEWEKTGTAFDAGERKNRIACFLGKGYINS